MWRGYAGGSPHSRGLRGAPLKHGDAVRHHWNLDPDVAFCNNGSFGATPIPVMEAQRALRDEMERQPVAFHMGIGPRIRAVADVLGDVVGADGRDLVFVDNATAGVNTVLASLEPRPGDVWLTTSHVYNAVRQAMRHFAGRGGAKVVEADLPFPTPSPDAVLDALKAAWTPAVRLVVIDHITSATGLVFPVERVVAWCREVGAKVLVDSAHVPGQIPFDLNALGADWVVANCHKWLFTPKGCALLWVRRELQANLHPLVISHGYGLGFHEEFDWVGTKDPTPWLAIPASIGFLRGLGGVEALGATQRMLRREAAAHILGVWGTKAPAPDGMLAALQTLEPPFQAEPEMAPAIHDALLERHGVEVPVFPFGGRVWIRISAQIYTRASDWARLAVAVDANGVR